MKCQNCENELTSNAKFCSECSEKVEKKNITECPMCHQPIAEGIIICPNCKNNIHTYHVTPPPQTEQKVKNEHTKFAIICIVCCIAAVFCIVFATQSCTDKSEEKNNVETTSNTQITFQTNVDVDSNNLTKVIYAKDISFRVSPDWNDDKSHTVYNCSNTCILTFSFSKISNDSAVTKYKDIYDSNSKNNYLSHREKELNDTKLIIADYIDNENYYYDAGFYYEGYFYTFCLSDKQDKQEFCLQLGNKLLETIELIEPGQEQTEKQTEKTKSDISVGKTNALKSAKSYLEYSAFSYQGLINQLEYEKYSNEEAVYAADNCGADWNEQAVKSAASYLKYSSFSKDSLIDQLEYEGFTHEQAVYAAEQNGY